MYNIDNRVLTLFSGEMNTHLRFWFWGKDQLTPEEWQINTVTHIDLLYLILQWNPGLCPTPSGTKKFLVPPPINGDQNFRVNLSIAIFNLVEINELKDSVQIKMTITRSWFDS